MFFTCCLTESLPHNSEGAGVLGLETGFRSQPWCLLGMLVVTSLSKPHFICKLETIAPPLRIVIKIARMVIWERAEPHAWYKIAIYKTLKLIFFPFILSFKLLISAWLGLLTSIFFFLASTSHSSRPSSLGSLAWWAQPIFQPVSFVFTPPPP